MISPVDLVKEYSEQCEMSEVTDNAAASRFELSEEGKLAYANYLLQGNILVIPHVEADPALRGKGAAGRLMVGILEIARERKLKVQPICSYAVAYLQRHPEYHDLKA